MTHRLDHLAELADMLNLATPYFISGREPNVDWHGHRPRDQNVTICVRLSLRDRTRIVRALRAVIKQGAV